MAIWVRLVGDLGYKVAGSGLENKFKKYIEFTLQDRRFELSSLYQLAIVQLANRKRYKIMASKNFPNDRIVCNVEADQITFVWQKKVIEGTSETWQQQADLNIQCNEVADRLENGDSFASMKAYGIRAFLSDRSSDYRKFGPEETMKAMASIYAETLAVGVYKAKRVTGGKAGGIDPLLVGAVAKLKKISDLQAMAALKAYSKDQREAIAKNPKVVDLMAELRAQAAQAETADLGDLFVIEGE